MTGLSRFANYSFIRSDILIEHLEEADFLLGLRQEALRSPDFDLTALAQLERRLDAHLDGLVVGGERTLYELSPELSADDPWRVAAMAAALLALNDDDARRQVLALVPDDGTHASPGIAEALRYLPLHPDVERELLGWLESPAPGRLALAWEVLGFHRVAIAANPAPLVAHEDPAVRGAVAAAIGCGQHRHPDLLAGLWRDEDAAVRMRTGQARVRSGDPALLPDLREAISSPQSPAPWEIELLACLGDATDAALLAARLTDGTLEPHQSEAVVGGLATLGLPESVPALLNAIEGDPSLAPAAGQAFARITGLELPPAQEEELTEEEENESFEDLRPRPDPAGCRELWADLADSAAPEVRWRGGEELDSEQWLAQPDGGDLLTRREEITRLCYAEPDAWRGLELDAPAARQRDWKVEEPS